MISIDRFAKSKDLWYNKGITISLVGLIMRGPLVNLANVICLSLFGTNLLIDYIISLLCVVLFIIGFLMIFKHDFVFIIVSSFIFILFWCIDYLLHKSNKDFYLVNYKQFFFYVFPFFWLGYAISSDKLFLTNFFKIQRIKLIIAVITQLIIFIIPNSDVFGGDYMNASNALLSGMICVLYLAKKNRYTVDILLSILSLIVIMLCGSRGVFLCVLTYLFFCLFEIRRGRIRIEALIIGLTIIISLLFADDLVHLISKISSAIGYSSHLIDSLKNGNLLIDTNRIMLFENFLLYVKNNPFGYGIFGDRLISYTNFFYKPIYPHNLFIEVLIQFGWILGGLIISFIMYKIIKAFLSKNNEYREGIVVLFCITIVRLLFSGSFWDDQLFFLLLGILIVDNKHNIKLSVRRS